MPSPRPRGRQAVPADQRSRSLSANGADPALTRLVQLAERLNGPGGCPWDRAQTIDSLLPHLIEEVWELFYAHQRGRRRSFEEELGDVLYTVLFLAILSERHGWSGLEAIAARTHRKMFRRHPHVFGAQTAHTADDAYRQWQVMKRRETKTPSLSKRVRPLLVRVFDALSQGSAAIESFAGLIAGETASARSTRSNGPVRRGRGRSSRQA